MLGGICPVDGSFPLAHFQISHPLAFQIIPFGRFGNDFYQLLTVLGLCYYLRISNVFITSGYVCLNRSVVTALGVHISPGESPFVSQTIKGHFFRDAGGCATSRRFDFSASLRPVYAVSPGMDIESDQIFLHVRGSDCFRREGHVNPFYGQPPCSFYLDAIALHANVSKVFVVTDGGGNPCISYLHERGAVLLETPVCQAIGILTHARRYVLARSTFSRAALLVSAYYDTGMFYTCWEQFVGSGRHWDCEPTLKYRYLLFERKWRAAPRQLALMSTERCVRWTFLNQGSPTFPENGGQL
jgi:hypothetical protein